MQTEREERRTSHPMRLVESKTLRSLERRPVAYELRDRALCGRVSDVQRDTIARVCASLQTRGLFLLGDGTGVGKGRVLGGTIAEYLARHGAEVRCLWCSANRGLHSDASRDLRDVGAPPVTLFRADVAAGDHTSTTAAYMSYGTIAFDEDERCLSEVVAWMRQKPIRLIVLDEAHLLRRRSAAAARVHTLVDNCACCHVVYSTATLASHPSHMHFVANMIGGDCALESLQRGGKGALEVVAMELKMNGLAVSRQLDHSACRFQIVEHEFSAEEARLYSECLEVLDEVNATGFARQLFVRTLVTSFKARTALREARRALAEGQSVVIAVQHTGEAAALRDCGVSCMQHMLQRMGGDIPAAMLGVTNAIDALVLDLHGAFGVAEVTGRRTRLEMRNGAVARVRVTPIRREIEAFQSGAKRVAILSRAGSMGIGLHATTGARRTHILLELAWSAEDHLQQCGRTYRATSSSRVEYVLVSSTSLVDARVEGVVYNRLTSLGAVTHADRHACTRYMRAVADAPCSVRRVIAARLMLAQAVRRLPEALTHAEALRTPPAQALAQLGARDGASPFATVCATLSRSPTAVQVATCLAALAPMSLGWTFGARHDWRRDVHCLPAPLRARVHAVREGSYDPRCRLSSLPDVIVDAILDYALSDYFVDGARAADAADALETCIGGFDMLASQPLAWTLNRANALPLALQTVLVRLLRSHAAARDDESAIRDLVDVLSTPTARVARVTLRERTSRRSVIGVEVVADTAAASACRRAADGRAFVVVAARGGVGVGVTLQSADAGHRPSIRMSAAAWEGARADGAFVACDAEEARAILGRAARAADRSARRLSGRYVVVHTDMLRYWEQSQRAMVRFRADNGAGVHVGLLVGKTATV